MHSLASLLLDSAARHPDRCALLDERSHRTYAALAAQVEHLSEVLLGLGVGSQGRIAVFLDKSVEAAAVLLAAMHAGTIAVPINPKLKPAQVRYILADCGAEVLVTSAHRQRELDLSLEGLALTTLLVDTHTPSDLSWPTVSLSALLAAPRRPVAAHRRIDADPAAILYTSGSTGQPKGVVVSHRNLVAGCLAVNGYLGTHHDDVILALLPISFDAGLSPQCRRR